MRGLYSGFDAARASWEFPEGTCAGFLGELKGDIEDVHNDDDCSGYPSDPVSDGLESTTGEDAADQKLLDNDQDTAVKVEFQGLKKKIHKNYFCRLVSPLLVLVVFALPGTQCCGRTGKFAIIYR